MQEMERQYDDLMFDLSDSSTESIVTVESFSVEKVYKFLRQLNRKHERMKKNADNRSK